MTEMERGREGKRRRETDGERRREMETGETERRRETAMGRDRGKRRAEEDRAAPPSPISSHHLPPAICQLS